MAAASFDHLELAVVCVQYDRQKYAGALERLIGFLEGLSGVDYTLVVVDNGNPGNWFHELSRNVVHLGGDNQAWEFSAFDKGLAFLEERQQSCDLFAFATDACSAYGSDYLNLIDIDVLRCGIELEACFGWIDTFAEPLTAVRYYYRDWIRTSLFFVPSGQLPQLTPLATPFDRALLFSESPEIPFLDSAPLSDNLKNRLLAWLTTHRTEVVLEEVWHSQFELDASSFGFFQDKVSAILREHLLSARIQYEGIPGFDLRLLRQLVDADRSPASLSQQARDEWQWTRWRDAEVRKGSRFGFDLIEVPRTVRHGEPAALRVIGWVVTEPQVEEVFIELSGYETVGGRCDIARGDPGSPNPELADRLRGFDLSVPLDRLPPGSYDVVWRVIEPALVSQLGKIDVLPRFAFEPSRGFIPDTATRGRQVPISMEGKARCSDRIDHVEVLWNGELTTIEPLLHAGSHPSSGLWGYQVTLIGEVPLEEGALQQRLELRFVTEEGKAHSWRAFKAVAVEETVPHVLSVQHVGDYDPKTRSVSIHFRGAVEARGEEDRLIFLKDDQVVFEEPLSRIATRGQERWWFEVRKVLSGITPGTSTFSLAVAHAGSAFETVHRWQALVKLARPRASIDIVTIEPPTKRGDEALLTVAGWLEHHRIVDGLGLYVDGRKIQDLAIDQLRPDVAEHFGETLLRHQGFATQLATELEVGPHTLELATEQDESRSVIWQTTVEAPGPPGTGFHLESWRLEELADGGGARFESAIQVAGEAHSRVTDVDGILFVDGREVDRQVILPDGSFSLRHVPERSGIYPLRVVFRSGERTLYDTGTVDVEFVAVDIPYQPASVFDQLTHRFKIHHKLGLTSSPDILRRLLEHAGEDRESYLKALREIGGALELALPASRDRRIAPTPEPIDCRPLKVLFATWEVPSMRHGGGVCMINILKHLSQKHQITLLHSYGRNEKGWVDEARPYAHKVISVLRKDQPPPKDTFPPILSHLYQGYVPDLLRAVESEVFTGEYDLVDYHYVSMFPYRSRAAVPRVMTVHEERFAAKLANYGQASADGVAIERLDDLLRAFYFSAVSLPRAFSHLIAFTPEDARVVSHFQNTAKVYLNGISVDMATFDPPSDFGPVAGDPPKLVVLGNYRHPPNVDSAKFFARRVMPGIWQRFPRAEFHIVGGFPPRELKRMAEEEPRIILSGFVDDFRPRVREAAVFVAPIFTGAGMRVKILEAMACAAPVVATRLAMSGIDAAHGEQFLAAESASEFVEACCRCIEQPDLGRRIGDHGRELMTEKYNHQRLGDEREAIWYEVIADWQAASPPPAKPSDDDSAA